MCQDGQGRGSSCFCILVIRWVGGGHRQVKGSAPKEKKDCRIGERDSFGSVLRKGLRG